MIGKQSTIAFSHFGLMRGRKNAGTKSENAECSDGIAATALPQSRADCQLLTKPFRPSDVKPRPVWRANLPMMWYLLDAIHGGAVGRRTNIAHDTISSEAKRFMNRAHSRWL